jgi:hypothetical protein
MSDNNTQTEYKMSERNPGLNSLDKLVGTWQVSGPDIDGQVIFEWMDGGFFLIQHFDLVKSDHKVKGIEIIGYQQGWETMGQPADPNQDLTSHSFDNTGNTFSYTWEVNDEMLTIWGGVKGSPAVYRGKFSDNGNINVGAWEWPGGGYESTMTRVK